MKRRSFFKSFAAAVSLPFVAKAAEALPEPITINQMPEDSPLVMKGTGLSAQFDGSNLVLTWRDSPEIIDWDVYMGDKLLTRTSTPFVSLNGIEEPAEFYVRGHDAAGAVRPTFDAAIVAWPPKRKG